MEYMWKCCRCFCTLPRIVVPHKVTRRLEKNKLKQIGKNTPITGNRKFRGALIIDCKRKEYNHYKGQTYSDFSPKDLASGGWQHYKSKGDYFTIQPIHDNPSLESDGNLKTPFSTFGLDERLVKSLEMSNITHATNIQKITIPEILHGKSVLCTAETGSGKTLAFLLPILHRLCQLSPILREQDRTNKPIAVILTPLRELADQIHNVINRFTDTLPSLKSYSFCGGRGTQKILKNPPVHDVDILVSTPGIFSKLLTNKIYSMSRLNFMVMDEADTLLDDSFNELTIRVLNKIKLQSEQLNMENDGETVGTQLAFVGATIPKDVNNIVKDIIPIDELIRLSTPYVHRILPHVPQKFVRTGLDEKPELLLKHLKKTSQTPTIVFCNKSSTAGFLHMMLEQSGVENVLYHAQMSQEKRGGRFDKFQNGSVNVLVCTDIASRGLDTIRARHIINYEFPHFMSDYIHRVGRVGRVGSLEKGFVLNFVSYPYDVELVWKIESAARRVTELHNVNANIKRKINGIIERKFTNKYEQELLTY